MGRAVETAVKEAKGVERVAVKEAGSEALAAKGVLAAAVVTVAMHRTRTRTQIGYCSFSRG